MKTLLIIMTFILLVPLPVIADSNWDSMVWDDDNWYSIQPPTEPILYGVDNQYGTASLNIINQLIGESTVIGRLDPNSNPDLTLSPNRFYSPNAMAIRPSDSTIFVWNSLECTGPVDQPCSYNTTRELLTVDPVTGAATRVGDVIPPSRPPIEAMAFEPTTETLYGFANYSIYTIDAATGIADLSSGKQILDGQGHRVKVYGADFNASGILYVVGADPDAPINAPDRNARLYTINPVSGTANLINGIPGTHVFQSITFSPSGALIGSRSVLLYDIDPTTGALSNERVSGGAWQGLGFVGTSSPNLDSDADGLPDSIEISIGTNPLDADTDDDGLVDGNAGSEDLNADGVLDPGETNPNNPDTDGDGIFDGTERGLVTPESSDTDISAGNFIPDADPSTTTDPTNPDTDGDGILDGEEDINRNGKLDEGESSAGIYTVTIDIKPDSYPNCINNDGHGVIPVAIISSDNFDATLVDPLTISLDGQSVRIVGKGNLQSHIEDVNRDGLEDLIVQVQDIDGSYMIGDTTARLTGKTFTGISIEGYDYICIVP